MHPSHMFSILPTYGRFKFFVGLDMKTAQSPTCQTSRTPWVCIYDLSESDWLRTQHLDSDWLEDVAWVLWDNWWRAQQKVKPKQIKSSINLFNYEKKRKQKTKKNGKRQSNSQKSFRLLSRWTCRNFSSLFLSFYFGNFSPTTATKALKWQTRKVSTRKNPTLCISFLILTLWNYGMISLSVGTLLIWN